jgi:hypothetical protein
MGRIMIKYIARHKKTLKEKEIEIPMAEVDQWEADNPRWEIKITSGNLHSGMGLGFRRVDDNFKDLLKTIKKGSPRSTVNIP